ncbi:MAG: DMT family transporter [Pseudomonadota bacterium]
MSDASASPTSDRMTDNVRGALWMVASCVAASAMMVAIRLLSEELDSRMIAFLRSFLGLLVVVIWLLDGSFFRIRITKPWLHVARGVLMAFATNLGFYAISALPMATANILFFLAPVFATALAGPILAERVGPRRWSAVIAGLLGTAIILRPGVGAFDPAMLAAVLSAVCFSVSLLLTRILGADNSPKSVMLTSLFIASLVTFPIALPVWAMPADLSGWALVAAVVVASNTRQYCDIRAYAIGEAGFLAPFSYLRLLFVAVAGWWLFQDVIDAWTVAGGTVIIGATLYIAQRESKLGKRIAGSAA